MYSEYSCTTLTAVQYIKASSGGQGNNVNTPRFVKMHNQITTLCVLRPDLSAEI